MLILIGLLLRWNTFPSCTSAVPFAHLRCLIFFCETPNLKEDILITFKSTRDIMVNPKNIIKSNRNQWKYQKWWCSSSHFWLRPTWSLNFVTAMILLCVCYLTHLSLASHKRDIANSVDPDQTPQNAASDQGVHCLHLVQKFLLNTIIIKSNQTPLIHEMDLSKELR